MYRLPFMLLGSGFLILALGIFGWFIAPQVTTETSSSSVENDVLEEGGNKLWGKRKDIATVNFLRVHLFDVKNPEDVTSGSTPILEEIGPLVYEQVRTRKTLRVDNPLGTVSYKDHVKYYFRPELSSAKESDIITIINVPWVGLAQELSSLNTIARLLVMGIVSRHNETVFMTRPISQLLFEGFYHPLIATFSGLTGETYMPNNTFGLFYGKNDTDLTEREVSLGTDSIANFGMTLKWKNVSEMGWWKEESCNKISGSDGTLFPPGIGEDSTLNVFYEEMCRNIKYKYKENIELEGVSGLRFRLPRSEYQNPKDNEENMCYCTLPGIDRDNCPEDGVYQINSCSKGTSMLLSLPHFLHGSPNYLRKVKGLHPDPETHDMYIDVEPITGTVLRSANRVQANIQLRPLKTVSGFRKVPDLTFPFVWTEESSQLSDGGLKRLRLELSNYSGQGLLPSELLSLSLAGFGIILIGVSIYIFIARLRKKPYSGQF